jgi:hypothetical protein
VSQSDSDRILGKAIANSDGIRGDIEGAERIRHLEHDKRLLIEALTMVVNNPAIETKQLRDATDVLAKVSSVFRALHQLS